MRKTIALLIALVMIVSSFSCASAADQQDNGTNTENMIKKANIEELRDALTDLSEKFPEARIDVESNLEYARQHSNLSVDEQLEYYRELQERGPVEVYKHVEADGSYAVLNVYGPMALESYGVTLGTTTQSGNNVVYTGSEVWANHICNLLLAYAWYSVNHNYNNQTHVGTVSSVYSPYCMGSVSLVLGNPYIYISSGGYSDVWYRLYEPQFGNVYNATISLKFNASSFGVTADYIFDPYA